MSSPRESQFEVDTTLTSRIPSPAWESRKELLDLPQQRQLTHLKERLEQNDSLQDPLMQVQEDITDPYTATYPWEEPWQSLNSLRT